MKEIEDERFEFKKLHVYKLAIQVKPLVDKIIVDLPTGYGDLKSQLRRNERSIRLNIAEGAGKRRPGSKAERYRTARASANECAAALDEVRTFDLGRTDLVEDALALLHRIISMLSKLIIRWDPEI